MVWPVIGGPTSWTWGSYRMGMGLPDDPDRMKFACLAIKKELVWLDLPSSSKLDISTSKFGKATRRTVKEFQTLHADLAVDGRVGRQTASALWHPRINKLQDEKDIPEDWMRAQVRWESGNDPGAEYTNPDGSRDRGLVQLNSGHGHADDLVFDPSWSLDYIAKYLHQGMTLFILCDIPAIKLAVARWRAPTGASDWCHHPETVPNNEGTWAEKVAYYVGRVDTDGRTGWYG